MSSPDIKSLLAAIAANPDAKPADEAAPEATPHPLTVAENFASFKKSVVPGILKLPPFKEAMTAREREVALELIEGVFYASANCIISIIYHITTKVESEEEGIFLMDRLGKEVDAWQRNMMLKALLTILSDQAPKNPDDA
jgi:hypothetical protein